MNDKYDFEQHLSYIGLRCLRIKIIGQTTGNSCNRTAEMTLVPCCEN
jgi:hypothetical protein